MMRFDSKVAVVTGAGGGMGLAVALGLLREGARVAMIDIKPQPGELDAHAGRFCYFQADLSQFEDVRAAFDGIVTTFGQVDCLANVAGVLWFGRDKGAVEIDLDVWDQVMAINLKSVVHTARCAVPLMKAAGGGAMVHVSTIQFLRGDTQPQDAYQASKAGVCALSRSLAIQYAGDNIRSNTVLPGVTWTPLQARWEDRPDIQEAVADAVPLRRMGTAEDMARACLFLLSDDASYITGIDLPVDGGLLVKPVA